jgi:hypothetical protein
MSNTVDLSFIDQWRDEVLHDFQVEGGQLRKFSRVIPLTGADTAFVHRLGQGSAVQKARHAKIPPMNVAHSTDSISVQDWYAGEYINDLDMLKTNVNFKQEYNKVIKQAIGRAEDDNLLDGLAAAITTNGETISAGAAATFADVSLATRALRRRNVPGGLIGLISYDFLEDMMSFANVNSNMIFSSGDFNSEKPIVQGLGRMEFDWYGVHWYCYNNLPTTNAGATQQNFIYAKDVLIHALQMDLTMSIDKVPEMQEWFATGKASWGTDVFQTEGVVAIERNYTAVASLI